MSFDITTQLIRKIREQADANGGWLDILLRQFDGSPYVGPGSSTIRVARNPFILWALAEFNYERHGRQRPSWQIVCPDGVRMPGDSGLHSDWVLSAGLLDGEEYGLLQTPRVPRNVCIVLGINHAQSKLLREWSSASFVTLVRGQSARIFGRVVHPQPGQAVAPGSVAIVPQASPAYQAAMLSACGEDAQGNPGAIICELGGPMTHLASIGRESRCTVLRLEGAMRRYPAGCFVSIDLASGTVEPTA